MKKATHFIWALVGLAIAFTYFGPALSAVIAPVVTLIIIGAVAYIVVVVINKRLNR